MSLLRQSQKIFAVCLQEKNREIQHFADGQRGSNGKEYREGISQYVEEIKQCTVEIEVRLSISHAVLVDRRALIEFASRGDLLEKQISGTFTNAAKAHTQSISLCTNTRMQPKNHDRQW